MIDYGEPDFKFLSWAYYDIKQTKPDQNCNIEIPICVLNSILTNKVVKKRHFRIVSRQISVI